MLYVIHGTNTKRVSDETRKLVKKLLAKKPGAMRFEYDTDSFTPHVLEEHMGGQGLFEEKYIVVLKDVLGTATTKKVLLDQLGELHASDNVFIAREGKLDSRLVKKLEKEKVMVVEYGTNGTKKEFNVFALADVVRERNRKKAWMLYRKALKEGKSAEEINGIIAWQLKSLVLVEKSKDLKESGLKPFVYNKTKASLSKFEKGEPEALLWESVRGYHEARRGNGTLETTLEQFLLEI